MTQKPEQRFAEHSEREEYLHKHAWSVVQRQIGHAEANPAGFLYDYLVAMLFAFFSIEGYLNFVGGKIAPCMWANEKENFKGAGIDKKLKEIRKQCALPPPDKRLRPYSTLIELKELRDKMAHPKTHKAKHTKRLSNGKAGDQPAPPYLSTLVSRDKALRARDDVMRVASEIHVAAATRFPDACLGPDALEGIHSIGVGTTRPA